MHARSTSLRLGSYPFLTLCAVVLLALSTAASAQHSALHSHLADCEHGRDRLEALRRQLLRPRHGTQVTLEIESISLRHGRSPDDHRAWRSIRDVRVFEVTSAVGDDPAWRLDVEARSEVVGGWTQRLRINDRFAIDDPTGGPGEALEASDALREQLVQRAAFPATLLHYLCTVGHVLGVQSPSDRCVDVLVALPGGRALVRTAAVRDPLDMHDESELGIVGVDWVTHSELLGDVVETLTYSQSPPPAVGVAAGWSIVGPFGTGEVARATGFELDSQVEPFAGGMLPGSAAERAGAASSRHTIELSELGHGAFELLVVEEASRCIAVDLGPGWAVLELPVSSDIGEALIRALEEEKPGHAFLYAAASHHHPHYIGGLRPFVARGASVVCPAEVAGYVEQVLHRPRTLQPDALSRSDEAVRVLGVEAGERWAPRESPGRLVAVEAAGRSAHTDAFILFFLPESKLAFGGDLLWLPEGDSARAPNQRTLGLELILSSARDLEVTEFLTSWPAGRATVGGRVWKDRVPIAEIVSEPDSPTDRR